MVRRVVVVLLFLCSCVGWSVEAFAACSQPATTVFFLNGVDNSIPDASASADALAQKLGAQLAGECLKISFAYNATGTPLNFDSDTVDSNVRQFRAELALMNKVVLVPHSNGNTYAREAYGRLTPAERTSVGVVSVATLLGAVPGDGPYVTLQEDTFIAFFPNALPPNTTNTGGSCPQGFGCHAFIDFYLNGQVSGPKIVGDVSGTIPRLARPPGGTFVGMDLNGKDFGPGDTLHMLLRVTNGAPAQGVDFYLGFLAPDGVTASFVTSLSPFTLVTVSTSNPGGFRPLVRGAGIPQGLDFTLPDALVMTFPPDFAEGQSFLFAGITTSGTQTLVAPIAINQFSFSQ